MIIFALFPYLKYNDNIIFDRHLSATAKVFCKSVHNSMQKLNNKERGHWKKKQTNKGC